MCIIAIEGEEGALNMKTKKISFLGIILWFGLTMNGWSQTKGEEATSANPTAIRPPSPIGKFIGGTVEDYGSNKLGVVEDLLVDLENGRIVEVVVDKSGFWGRSKPRVAAPPECFQAAADAGTFYSRAEKDKLFGAPVVDLSKWDEVAAQSRVEDVYRYFGLTPYFLVQERLPHGANDVITHPLGLLRRAGRLFGVQLVNLSGDHLGNVQDLIADLPRGRLVEVIIDTGDYMGMRGELSAVPPQALHSNSDGTLTLDTTKLALIKAPHFAASAWPRFERGQIVAVYQTYHVLPYLLPFGN